MYIFFTGEVSTMNYSAGGKFSHILSFLLKNTLVISLFEENRE